MTLLAAAILLIGIGGGTDGQFLQLHSRMDIRVTSHWADSSGNKGSNLDAILWAAHVARPGRPACGGTCSVEAVGLSAGRELRADSALGSPDRGLVEAIICAYEWACFRQGYRDFGGNPAWEGRFVDVIETCESEGHSWADTYDFYLSRAQFHPDSWRTASQATGYSDPTNPYHVGANVAVWSNATDPGGAGGWASCWNRGLAE